MIKKKIDSKNILYIQKLYPYMRYKKDKKPYNVLLGIGGNIGDVRRRFNHLFIFMQKSPYLSIMETAPILKNPPFGYLKQDYFYNSLIYIKTYLQPKVLLRYILALEKKFHRKRSFKDAPRTLDIDIIFYEDFNIKSKDLTIPHPLWQERNSVTIPLNYMKNHYIKSVYSELSNL
jgi:2-amino-4-hydroxy-6-hydroxymethyldihydropteridine diphosphokinase